MPAKMKYTAEQIVKAALELVREKGASALSARALAKKLGTSTQPIFSCLDNMERVQTEVVREAKRIYAEYVKIGLAQTPAFKGVGMQYILFARDDPELFGLLFMSETDAGDVTNFMPAMDDNSSEILRSVKDLYSLNDSDARRMYNHLAIYTHGIAVLLARRTCDFSVDEISSMLTEVFTGVLRQVKGEKAI